MNFRKSGCYVVTYDEGDGPVKYVAEYDEAEEQWWLSDVQMVGLIDEDFDHIGDMVESVDLSNGRIIIGDGNA